MGATDGDAGPDPRLGLRPELTLSYEDGALRAEWPPIAAAYGYRVEVRDTGDTLLYAVDIDAETYDPPVSLESDTFTPAPSTTYIAAVWVRGMPSEPQTVTTYDLAAPVLAAHYSGAGVRLSWPAVEHAATYELRVTQDDDVPVLWRDGLTDTDLEIGTADGLATDVPYAVRARARAGNAVGRWSEPLTVTLPSAGKILLALRDRLVAARSAAESPPEAFVYTLDTTTLPAGAAGEPDRVLDSLSEVLGPAPAVTTPDDPQLDEAGGTLTLTGTSAVLAPFGPAPVTLVFLVSDLALEATWTLTPGDGWHLGDTFPVLVETGCDHLSMRGQRFVATTYPHTDPDYFFPLEPGLQFQGTLRIRTDLLPVTEDPGETDVATVRVGGSVTVAPDGRPTFAWSPESALPALSIARVGQSPLTVVNGMVRLESAPDDADAEANTERLTVAGTVDELGVPCQLGIPTSASPTVTLVAEESGAALATIADALAAGGVGDVLGSRLPAALLELASAQMTGYAVTFSPAGATPTETTLTLSVGGGPWPLVPDLNLAVGGLTLRVTVSRAAVFAAQPAATYGGQVSGLLRLGETDYSVTAGIRPSGSWYVEIVDEGDVPTLENLLGLTGLTTEAVHDALPPPLLALGTDLTLSRVALWADPFTQDLTEVEFEIAQTRPWPIAGDVLTASDWVADMSVQRIEKPGDDGVRTSEWRTSGVLTGRISLASGNSTTTVNVRMALPVNEDALWTLSLDQDTPAHIPTIDQILDLLGGGHVAVPAGIGSLGGLDVTRFSVSLDASAARIVHVEFACVQAGDWIIIPPDTLTVTGLDASLSFRPGDTRSGATGYLRGFLTLAGGAVDVAMLKNGYDDVWLLQAGYENPVHVPGFEALNSWLSPEDAKGYLPDKFPLTHGFDVGDVALRFGGENDTLDQISFAIAASDLWTVITDRLSVTDVLAELTLPYPLRAGEITGYLRGVVTIGGIHIAVQADRPDTTGPWKFTGSLREGLTIDVLAAVNALAETADRALPADATAYGLPASITVKSADVTAVPETGMFHFAGSVGFDWQFSFGHATLAVRALGTVIDVPDRDSPLTAALTGEFGFAGLTATLMLRIGTQDVPVELTGTVAPDDVSDIEIGGITDGIAAGTEEERWASVVPSGLATLAFTGAALYLNLTQAKFLLYGSMSVGGTLAADAFVYCARATVLPPPPPPPLLGAPADAPAAARAVAATAPSGDLVAAPAAGPVGSDTDPWIYAVAVALGPGFRFASLLPVLSVVDDHLRVTEARLVVCNLRGEGTLGELAQTTTTLLAAIDPQARAPLAGLTGDAQALRTGACLVARIDFDTITLFSRLLQIGDDATPPSVRLYALIDAADPTRTVFAADLPDITVAATIRLTHTDDYPGIHLSYRPSPADRFDLAGRVEIIDLFDTDYGFDVTLSVDDDGLESAVRQTTQTMPNPFGLPGIELSELALAVSYTWAKPAKDGQQATPRSSRYVLQGHVLLGPAPGPNETDQRLSVAGRLALRDGTPALFYAAVDRDFSIGKFLAQCVTGAGSSWPSDFVDVVFLDGTRISYYAADADPGGTLARLDGFQLENGFTVNVHVRVTLLAEITVSGVLRVLRDAESRQYVGVRAELQLDDPLDLVFVAFAGPTAVDDGPYTAGPVLAFETGDAPRFGLSTGINFLGTAFLAVEVGVRRDAGGGTKLDGRLQAPRRLEPFGLVECDFVYITHPGRDGEFRIENWPDFSWARNLIDFVKAIRDLCDTTSESACGQLVDFVAEETYDSTFEFVNPSVTAQGTDLAFTLTGKYALTITGASGPFLTMTFPSLVVAVPMTTRWEDAPEALAGGIAAGAEKLVRDLVNQPDKVALFLAMLLGEKAASVALELACNALVDGAVAAAAAAGAAAIAEAGGAAAAGAVAAATAAILASLQHSKESNGGGGGGDPGQPQRPTFKRLAYADEHITGSWDAARNASGYTFQVLDPGNAVLASASYGYALSGSVPVVADSLAVGDYQGQVRSTRGELVSDWATLTITKAAGPACSLHYAAGELSATWPDAGATGYRVRFFAPGGQPLGDELARDGAARGAAVALPDPVAGSYSARVRSLKQDQIPSTWGEAATLDVLTLPAPTLLGVRHEGSSLTVEWAAGSGNLTYEARVTTGDTVVASAAVGATRVNLTPPVGHTFEAGHTYTVGVRAHGTDAVSPWSTRDIAVAYLPAVTGVTVVQEIDHLVATWERPVGTAPEDLALTYTVALFGLSDTAELSEPGGPIDPSEAGEVSAPAEQLDDAPQVAVIDGITGLTTALVRADKQPFHDGERYGVRVRAVAGDNEGPFSDQAEIAVIELPAPGSVSLTRNGDFRLQWTPPALPDPTPPRYEAVLAVADDRSPPGWTDVGSAHDVEGDSTRLARTDEASPGLGELYRGRVRATLPLHTGHWGESGSVVVTDVVTVTDTAYAGQGEVTASWSASEVPDAGYEVALDPPSGSGIDVTVAGTGGQPAPTATSLDLGDLARGAAYRLRVRVLAAGLAGAWSAPRTVAVIDPPETLELTDDGTDIVARWSAVTGATGYHFALLDERDDPVATRTTHIPQTPDPTRVTIPAGQLPRNARYTGVVVALLDDEPSPPSAGVTITLLDRPGGLSVGYEGGAVKVGWQPVTGAAGYEVLISNGLGQTAGHVETKQTTALLDRSALLPGITYVVRVRASAEAPGPWASATLPPASYSCLCLGTTPGASCGAGGRTGAFADFLDGIGQIELDTEFQPTRTPSRTGWVALPDGPQGAVAILAQLVITLTTKGFLTGSEPFDVFSRSAPEVVKRLEQAGQYTCLCLGMTPGQECGGEGLPGEFGEAVLGVSQAALDTYIRPTLVPRTGWVAIRGEQPHLPQMILLRLVTLLSQNGKLVDDEPYEVFNATTAVTVLPGEGGDTTAVYLGSPVGQPGAGDDGPGCGDLILNASPDQVQRLSPGTESGWAVITVAHDYSVPSAIVHLTAKLTANGVLSGDEPYAIFGDAPSGQAR